MLDEVDKKLEMSLGFSFQIESYVLSTIAQRKPVPVNIYHHNNEYFSTFFIDDASAEERMLFDSLNPVKMGKTLVITEKISSPVVRKISEGVGLVPTLADGELYTEGETVYSSFRFHSSELAGATELLRSVVSLDANISEIELTKSKGLKKILCDIDRRIPLAVVRFSLKGTSDKEHILEWRNTHQRPFSHVKYTMGDENSVESVVLKDLPTEPFLASLDQDRIPLGSYLEYHGRERIQAYAYVPSLLVKPLLVRLYQTSETMDDFRIESIENFREITS